MEYTVVGYTDQQSLFFQVLWAFFINVASVGGYIIDYARGFFIDWSRGVIDD